MSLSDLNIYRYVVAFCHIIPVIGKSLFSSAQ